jgi:hypothetical protein
VTVCGLDFGLNYGSLNTLWGIVGTNGVKNGVGFDCVLIVNLIIVVCFTVYVKFLNDIHKSTFAGRVKYLPNFIGRSNGVFIFQ